VLAKENVIAKKTFKKMREDHRNSLENQQYWSIWDCRKTLPISAVVEK
jgi:hypothetical protein